MNEMLKKEEVFLNDIRGIINSARQNAVRSVDFCRVQMYWHMGKRIFEEEQQGKDRADYGAYLIKNLAKQLEPEYGSGFSYRQLAFCRQFYRVYPIANALRSQLNWTQYRMLIQINDPDKRMYYELESVNNGWTARETERQINSQLYERLLLSNDKENVLAVARRNGFRNRLWKSLKTRCFWSSWDWNARLRIMRKIWSRPSSPICNISCLNWDRALHL